MKQIPCQVVGEYYRQPAIRELAKGVKQGDKEAIHKAAQLMAPMVEPGDVLVPVPGHTGKAVQMLSLSRELARLTGAKLADVMEGNLRESSYNLKLKGVVHQASEMRFRLTGQIPQGRRVWLVDNVVASGNTASAALTLIPQAQVLALAIDSHAIGRLPGIDAHHFLKENIYYQQMIMEQTYFIKAQRQQCTDYYVEAPSYEKMKEWMNSELLKDKNPEVSYNPDSDINIIGKKIHRKGPQYTLLGDEKNHFQAKGYDLKSGSYVFSVVDTWSTVKPYKAESAEMAVQMAIGEQLHNKLIHEEPVRETCSADWDKRVVLDNGQVADIVSEQGLTNLLREKFPDGLTVVLAEECFDRLSAMQDKGPDDGLLYGMGNAGNDRMPFGYGPFEVELRLKPEDYNIVYAEQNTYYNNDLSELGFDMGVVQSTMMVAEEKELKSFRVEIPFSIGLQDALYVDGRPYKDFMRLAKDYNATDDMSMKAALDKEYLKVQPQWLQNMAHEETKDIRQKYWVEKVAPVNAAYYKAYDDAVARAAETTGFSSGEELKQAFERKPYQPDMIERLTQANLIIREAHDPALEKATEANLKLSQLKSGWEADYIRRFNQFCKENVRDITLGQNKAGQWMVRCQIAGEQQMSKMLRPEDAKFERNGTAIKLLGLKYFADEIKNEMSEGQKQSKGLGR